MTIDFGGVFVTATGKFLPGDPVDNASLSRFIAPVAGRYARIQRRILADNGIVTRHYAIDEHGTTRFSAAAMAAEAVRDCLRRADLPLADLSVLCTGSSGGDLAVPGLANMVQGELGAGPMHTSSHQGVCASGMVALQHAASALVLGDHRYAAVVASELPSRMFKHARFAPAEHRADFDAHFLRFMLSDGAGAWLLGREPARHGSSLRLDWIHTRSFSGDHPVCMHLGTGSGDKTSYLDYASLGDAERDGAFLLRQDIRMLPQLFELGIHEYVELVRRERIDPKRVNHFLCHYSSEKFAPVVEELMRKTGVEIPRARWYSNLSRRGNTGSASIFIMLDDFLREHNPRPGEQILCFVPESGRFTLSFAQFTVVESHSERDAHGDIAPPHAPRAEKTPLSHLIAELASVWHGYQSRLRRTPLIRKITSGQFDREAYRAWLGDWIPQVRHGSHWMRRAAQNLGAHFRDLKSLVEAHAQDESEDYTILFEDYQRAGGSAQSVDELRRNPGGEALHAYMVSLAERKDPVALLGAIYIIEGTGQRVVPALLPAIKRQVALPAQAFRFLAYHGENDVSHLTRWLRGVEIVVEQDTRGELARAIVDTARATAELYLLQFQSVAVRHES